MQIVINVPDFIYKHILKRHVSKRTIAKIFENGVVLPKGHGRLIDADEAINKLFYSDLHDDSHYYGIAYDILEETKAIIETDKGG